MKRLTLLSLLLAACAPQEISSSSAAIIGGVRDTGDPGVVLLISYPSNMSTVFTCTASVISPTVLVTAAHCVDATNHPGYVFGAFLGDDASGYSGAAQFAPVLKLASAVHAHPSYDPNPPFTADIGVVVLAAPLTITPLPMARSPLPSSLTGQPARLVGYGQTVYNTYNATKYAAATSVASLPADDTVVVGDVSKHSCVGDSGGPALSQLGGQETIIGVDSYTDTPGCTEPSHYRRVDQYLPFLDTYAPPPVVNDLGTASDLATGANDLASGDVVDAATSDAAIGKTSDGGCSMSGAHSSSPWILLLLAMPLWRRYARGRSARAR